MNKNLIKSKDVKNENESNFSLALPNRFIQLVNNNVFKNTSMLMTQEGIIKRLAESYYKKTNLKLKFGIDPSGDNLHIGHFVVLKKIRDIMTAFPNTELDLIFGTFTVKLHDPTGSRKLHDKTMNDTINICHSFRVYLENYFRKMKNRVQYHFNHTWLGQLKIEEMLSIVNKIKVHDMLKKFPSSNLTLDRLFYPFMQAYDSYVLNTDIEFGGIDQLLNIMMGRDVTKILNNKAQECFFTPLITDINGNKMSKSKHETCIYIDNDYKNFYKKIMSLDDSIFFEYRNVLSSHVLEFNIKTNINSIKNNFALELLEDIHNVLDINEVFKLPYFYTESGTRLIDVLALAFNKSKLYFRKLLKDESIRLNDEPVTHNIVLTDECFVSFGREKLHIKIGKNENEK